MIRRGTLTIYRTYFLESDIYDGDFPRDDTRTELEDDLTAEEVVRFIRREGLTFQGNRWAADPDGSRIVDYATGQRVEVSAHLDGWPERVARAIMVAVDARP